MQVIVQIWGSIRKGEIYRALVGLANQFGA
jgi:hypothetical protein